MTFLYGYVMTFTLKQFQERNSMSGKCNIKDCAAPDIRCHLNHDDHSQCPHFNTKGAEKKDKVIKSDRVSNGSNLNWSGNPLMINQLAEVGMRSTPIVIGMAGMADAGKTSFLAMIYTLLLNGKSFADYQFAGSKTILGWDALYHRLKLKRGGVSFPLPTPASALHVYHFALKDEKDHLKDLLLSDVSGESFHDWSVNRDEENAKNARWVYATSSAFILFIDCEALIDRKNAARRDVMRIAKQLTHDLQERPVIAVWSKSDRIGEVLPNMISEMKKELAELFSNFKEIEISNFLEPGPDELVQINNLVVVDWILEKTLGRFNSVLSLPEIESLDLLIKYRGK